MYNTYRPEVGPEFRTLDLLAKDSNSFSAYTS